MAERQYDLVISGAGPAGTACAMALEDSGLRIALLDKQEFPRDKICGDFVAAKGIRDLLTIKPSLQEKLDQLDAKVINRSTQLIVGDMEPLQLNWVLRSYTIKREIFDNLLLDSVIESGKIDFFPSTSVKKIERQNSGLEVRTSTGDVFRTSLIVGADGAHSAVARVLANYKVDRNHYGGSVRAYFKGVENIDPSINEVYVHKAVLPGYFWLFPISETEANVGLGIHSSHITAGKINLKEVFYEFLQTSPLLKSKLANAEMAGKLEGFGLPFYSRRYTISGDNFLLCGDAASMIDPTNGEGIMPAVASGKMAAEQVLSCFEAQRFDADYTSAYEKRVHNRYWSEMRFKAWLVKMFANKNRILNSVAYICIKSPYIKRRLQKLL